MSTLTMPATVFQSKKLRLKPSSHKVWHVFSIHLPREILFGKNSPIILLDKQIHYFTIIMMISTMSLKRIHFLKVYTRGEQGRGFEFFEVSPGGTETIPSHTQNTIMQYRHLFTPVSIGWGMG